MSEQSKLSRPVKVVVYKNSQKLFERIFTHWPITFGRSHEMDVPLDFDFMSRAHCLISEEDGKICLNDLQSTNGVTVNGRRVEKCEIAENFKFKIGVLDIQLEVSPTDTAATTLEGTEMENTVSISDQILEEASKPADSSFTMSPPVPAKRPLPGFSKDIKDEQKEFTELEVTNQPSLEIVVPPVPPPAPQKPGIIVRAPKPPSQKVQMPPLPLHPPLPPPNKVAEAAVEKALAKSKVQGSRPVSPPNVVMASAPPPLPLHRKPVVSKNFNPDFVAVHPGLSASRSKKMEAVVMWHDQVYDVQEFGAYENITLGAYDDATLRVPTLRDTWFFAKIDPNRTRCYIPQGKEVTITRGQQRIAMGDLIAQQGLTQTEFGYSLKMGLHEVVRVDFGHNVSVHLRYIPSTAPLTKTKIIEPDEAIKQSLIGSAILHGLLLMTMITAAPQRPNGPKLKNVPERFARLLVDKKPKPKPTPTPAPTPEPKKIAEKKPEPIKPRQIKIPHKVPKAVAKVNKFPMVVKNPLPKAPPPVKVETLGALAALGAISKNPTNVVTNININKDAGGLPTKNINTGGIVGALPSSNGMLAAGGGPRVKTKGMGYGTGTGYGVQGLKGTAGGRGVAGAVVGEPKLASIAKTEGLTRAQVMAVVQKYLGEVQHCYERNLLMNPSLAGRLEFEWDISPNGRVTSVRVKRSTVNNGDNLAECVKGIFAGMHFPTASNGQMTTPSIGFPFGRL